MVASTLRILHKAYLSFRQIKSEQFGAFSGAHPTHRQAPNRLHWLTEARWGSAFADGCDSFRSGHLLTDLTWNLCKGTSTAVIVSALLFSGFSYFKALALGLVVL